MLEDKEEGERMVRISKRVAEGVPRCYAYFQGGLI